MCLFRCHFVYHELHRNTYGLLFLSLANYIRGVVYDLSRNTIIPSYIEIFDHPSQALAGI